MQKDNTSIGPFQKMVEKSKKNIQNQTETKIETQIFDLGKRPIVPTTPTMKPKSMTSLNEKNKNFSKEPAKRKSTITFMAKSFGPKAKSYIMSSKETLHEQIPEDSQNSNIFTKMLKIKNQAIPRASLSQLDSSEYSFDGEEFDSLKSFFQTRTSQLAKDEDNFWRYEREEEILNKHFKNIFGFVIEEKLSEADEEDNVSIEVKEMNSGGEFAGRSKKRKKSILKSGRSSKVFLESFEGKEGSSKKLVSFNQDVMVKKYKVKGKPKNLFFEG